MIEGKWKIDRSYKNICIEMMTENLASLRAKARHHARGNLKFDWDISSNLLRDRNWPTHNVLEYLFVAPIVLRYQ